MAYKVTYSNRFNASLKRCKKRGFPVLELYKAISILERDGQLPPQYKPHKLSGIYAGCWECHIKSDWLLIWEQNDFELTLLLIDTGSHSDLF